jgi:hypothetical protein
MNFMFLISFIIFLITLILVIAKPKSISYTVVLK